MRIPFRTSAALLAGVALTLAACSDRTAPTAPTAPDTGPQPRARPAATIADAARGGRAGFYFLAPLVAPPATFPGTFDPDVAAAVRICAGGPACPTPVATYTVGAGLTVDAVRQAYVATWPVPVDAVLGTGTYRLEVRAAGTLLGYADLFVATTPTAARLAPSGYVGVARGTSQAIRFRIETGMVGAVAVTPTSASIGVGATQGFAATATDLRGNPLPGATFDWLAADGTVASLSPASGAATTATALAAGSTPIVATSNGVSAAATLTVTGGGGAVAPVAAADAYTATAGVTLTVPALTGLLTNDQLGSPAATLTSFGGGSLGGAVTDNAAGATKTFGSGGSLTVNADGSLTFVPSAGFAGSFTFQYRLTNASGPSDATVTISVQRAPTAVNDALTVSPGGALTLAAPGILGNDDRGAPQGLVTRFAVGTLGGPGTGSAAGSTIADGNGGTLQVNADGSLAYQRAAGFGGTVTFQYELSNGVGTSIATVTLTVQQVPVAVNDAYTATTAGTLTVPAPGVLTNDTPGSPAGTVTSFGGGSLGGAVTDNAAGTTKTFGTGGSLTVNADGSLSFTRSSGFTGAFVVQYRLDNGTTPSVATITITVPRAPTAVADGPGVGSAPGSAYHTAFNTALAIGSAPTPALLGNDDRGVPQGDVTSFGEIALNGGTAAGTVTTNAAGSTAVVGTGGSLTVNADGTGSFTPPTNFTGLVTFRYRLTNSGGTSDATVTLAVGARPGAVADNYQTTTGVTLLGNVPINTATSTQFSVLANDAGDGVTAHLVPGSAVGGTVTALDINTGRFAFAPARGFTGNASFQYTVQNGFGATAAVTVTLPVANRVWFVNAGAAGGGDGTYATPYNTLAAFQAANTGTGSNPAANDRIFLAGGSYTGPVTLLNGQLFVGQGATEPSFGAALGVTWPADAGTQPAVGLTAPTITATGSDVVLASGNTLRGVTLGNATAAALLGSSFGTLTTSGVRINTSGQALSLSTGTLAGSFLQVSSSGGSNNVSLNAVATTGTSTLGGSGDALSGATGIAFTITGGTGSFTYPGSVTRGASAAAVNVAGKTGGTVTFSGSLNPGGAGGGILVTSNSNGTAVVFSGTEQRISTGATAGVSLAGNTGATISFTGGGLSVTTTTGDAFAASGGGTVSVTGTGNTLASAGGIALNVQNTTIGASGLTFRSISANGGSNGIALVATGSAGGLTVTGDGTTAGSGGTIQSTTGGDGAVAGNGVYLNGAQKTSLAFMDFGSHANNGIFGTGIRGGFVANRLRFSGNQGNSNSGSFDESPVHLVDAGGGIVVKNSVLDGGAYNALIVENIAGTAPTIDSLVVDGDTVNTMQGTTADVRSTALLVNLLDGTVDARIRNNRVLAWWGNGIHVLVQGAASGMARITNNFVDNTNGALAAAGGIWVAGGNLQYNISGNTVRHTNGTAISADRVAAGAVMQGTIDANAVGVSGDANSGSATGIGIFASHHGPGTTTVKISNNLLRQINGSASGAITTVTGDALAFGGSGVINATITGNDIRESGTTTNNAQHGILITHGTQSGPPTDSDVGCYDVQSNTIVNFVSGTANNRIRVNQRFATTSRWPGYTGAALGAQSQTDLAAYLLGRNTASTSTNANTSTGGFLNTAPAGTSCPQPSM